MSDTSINKYDGQAGWFGKWRDISAEELAYETKVRRYVGVIGGAIGLLCTIFAALHANGIVDDALGLGISIPASIVSTVMVPVGIFYNHGWHMRGAGLRGFTAPMVSPLEAEATQYIKNAHFFRLKNYFYKADSGYMFYLDVNEYEQDWRDKARVRNLEQFVNGGVLTPQQGNFVRAILEEHEEISCEITNLNRQKISVPSDGVEQSTYSYETNEKIRSYNQKNQELRDQNAKIETQIALKRTKLKEIEQRWNDKRPEMFAASLVEKPKR